MSVTEHLNVLGTFNTLLLTLTKALSVSHFIEEKNTELRRGSVTQTRSHSNKVGYLARAMRRYSACMYLNTHIVFPMKDEGTQPRAVM